MTFEFRNKEYLNGIDYHSYREILATSINCNILRVKVGTIQRRRDLLDRTGRFCIDYIGLFYRNHSREMNRHYQGNALCVY